MTLRPYTSLSLCFDLDGTIIDTAPDLIRVLNTVIKTHGLPETDFQSARRDVGYGSQKLITEAFARTGKPLTSDELATLQNLFLKLYAEDIARLSRPFPGVVETLRILKSKGANLSICTNKPGYLARPLVKALKMETLFQRVVGSDDVPEKKPNPAHIFRAVGHRDSSRIIMVGDSLPDILAAKNANVSSIVVSYGYSTCSVETLGADIVIRSFRDFLPALDHILSKER